MTSLCSLLQKLKINIGGLFKLAKLEVITSKMLHCAVPLCTNGSPKTRGMDIQLLPKSLNTVENFQYYATFHVPLNILGYFFCSSRHIFALDTFVTLYSNWYKKNFIDQILLGREYYLNISREETLCLLTKETVFRLLGSNCMLS